MQKIGKRLGGEILIFQILELQKIMSPRKGGIKKSDHEQITQK